MPVILSCPRCGARFSVTPFMARKRKYCSLVCRRGKLDPQGPRTASLSNKVFRLLIGRDGQTSAEMASMLGVRSKQVSGCLSPHVGTLVRKALDEHPSCAGVNRYWLTDSGRDILRKKFGTVERLLDELPES